MKARTKEIIRDGFGSLVSNASALRGAKAGPLWLTIVMFFLALLLPIIPIFSQQVTTNGSSFLNSYSYNLDRTVTSVAMDLKNNRNAEFIIGEDHMLSIKEGENEVNFSDYGSAKPYASYIAFKDTDHQEYELLVYISNADTDQQKENFLTEVGAINYAYNSIDRTDASESIYHPSMIVLFRSGIYVAVYANHATNIITNSYLGDFKTIAPNNKCLETLLKVDGVNQNLYDDHYTMGVYANFKKALDKSYETLKIKNTGLTCLIYFGIFFGASLLMSLLMFLLTRGKNNPNNYFSWWLCIKIQGRLSFCPGLLAMIVGFFLTSQIPLIMIMLLGLRVMWISMKELRPIAQN